MRELVRTNDPVLVSAIEALLNGADIPHVVLDTVSKGRREMKLLAYLAQRAPGEDWDRRRP